MNELDVFKGDFISLIENNIFPEGASFRCRYNSSSIACFIKWKLNNDPARPNKPSRKIKLTISDDLLSDYMGLDSAKKGKVKNNFLNYVKKRLKKFDPDHDNSKHQSPPEECWTINSDILK